MRSPLRTLPAPVNLRGVDRPKCRAGVLPPIGARGMTAVRPFADTYENYWQQGWLGVLPLPERMKDPPPAGFTGAAAPMPSWPDMLEWAEQNPGGNIAIRLPDNVVGIDVDAYDDKPGATTFADAEDRWGALAPTWISTSRTDGISGIRLYAVPPGARFRGMLGEGVEIVQRTHRYVVVSPSIHPEGRTYQWITPEGVGTVEPPHPDDLPPLPGAWVEGLRATTPPIDRAGIAGGSELVKAALTEGIPSDRVLDRLWLAVEAIQGSSRYEATLGHSAALLRMGKQGEPGVNAALTALYNAYVPAVAHARQGGMKAAEAEFKRMIKGAGPMLATPDTTGSGAERSLYELAGLPVPTDRDLAVAQPQTTREIGGESPSTGNESPLYGDVAALLDGTMPEPPKPSVLRRTDGVALFYLREINYLYGDPEDGKTWVSLAAVAQRLTGGGTAIFIDLDHNGMNSIIDRLLKLGAPPGALADRQRFRYCEPEDFQHLARIVADCVPWRPGVVVVDCIGELMGMRGANSDNADEYTQTINATVLPLVRAGAAAILIDHMAKGKDSRAYGAGGTMAKRRKLGGTSIRVEPTRKLVRGKGGELALIGQKDRHSGVREHCEALPKGAFDCGAFVLDESTDTPTWHIATRSGTPTGSNSVPRHAPKSLSRAAQAFIEPAKRLSVERQGEGNPLGEFTVRDLAVAVYGSPLNASHRSQARRSIDDLTEWGVLTATYKGAGMGDPSRWTTTTDEPWRPDSDD